MKIFALFFATKEEKLNYFMMSKTIPCVLKPQLSMFFIDNIYTMLLLMVSLLMTGVEDYLVNLLSVIAIVLIVLLLIHRYWYWATLRWEITEKQIKSTRGVFSRSVDYLELYRVTDFVENQNLLQQLLGIKDVYIISNDRTHPVTRIHGIPYSLDLKDMLDPLVKKSRKENQIYEIANN